jgi:hypothetical protein
MKTIKFSSCFNHMGTWSSEKNRWVEEFKIGEYEFTTTKSSKEVDGMICWWEFTEEFLEFTGPKVFYCCEPSFFFCGFQSTKRQLRRRISELRMDEFAWHYHPSPSMRVVHATGLEEFSDSEERLKTAVAVLGNLGRPIFRNSGRQKRLRFILQSGCDVFGPRPAWENFQLGLFSKPGMPTNYRGECERSEKLQIISKYHACICLENSSEPLYFTEKFPDAVRAGCIPIYHPHPSVKNHFLQGAVWVDPADYEFNGRETMAAALALDRVEVNEINKKWMTLNKQFLETYLYKVYSRLGNILAAKESGDIDIPTKARRNLFRDET